MRKFGASILVLFVVVGNLAVLIFGAKGIYMLLCYHWPEHTVPVGGAWILIVVALVPTNAIIGAIILSNE